MPLLPTDALRLTALELAQAIQQGDVTAHAVSEASLNTIEQHDEAVGAFLSLRREAALNEAAAVDAKVARGETLPLLAGVPIAIKDNISVSGSPATCASQMLANYVAPYDASVVHKLKHHGLPLIGKTNMDEFAMGSSTETSAFKLTHNPWNLNKVPGGSSGGSAACVSAGMLPLSLGSDTGGSVRQPASLCGLVGLKPTYGLVSRFGLVAYASSLDQISPFARTVQDCAALLQVIAGQDVNDMTSASAPKEVPNWLSLLQAPQASERLLGRKLRVGVVQQLNGEGMDAEVQANFQQVLATLQAHGAEISTVSIDAIKEALAAYYVIAPAECSSNLARFDGVRYGLSEREDVENVYHMFRKTRAKGFGKEVKRRILLGTFALSSGYYDAYYGKAQLTRKLLTQSFNKAFEQVDVLICPTSPTTAFDIGSKTDDPITMYLSDVATIPVNLAGIPAMSLPSGFDSQGLPMGVQLMAPRFGESALLCAAFDLQEALGLKNLVAPVAQAVTAS
ncbi:MAG: Asp-tRNA(Asn)/Glu-tRNA(Gln) amidotransferase subunit GatA [Vampirovibrionales bacterium]